jgi:hypothetical protein
MPIFGVWVRKVINEREAEKGYQMRHNYRPVRSPNLEQAGKHEDRECGRQYEVKRILEVREKHV